MEHLSRRTTRDVDVLLLVTDPTQRGLVAVQSMRDMVPELNIGVGHVYLVVNRLRGDLPQALADTVARSGLELIGTLPDDPALAELEIAGRPLLELPADAPAYSAIKRIAEQVL